MHLCIIGWGKLQLPQPDNNKSNLPHLLVNEIVFVLLDFCDFDYLTLKETGMKKNRSEKTSGYFIWAMSRLIRPYMKENKQKYKKKENKIDKY